MTGATGPRRQALLQRGIATPVPIAVVQAPALSLGGGAVRVDGKRCDGQDDHENLGHGCTSLLWWEDVGPQTNLWASASLIGTWRCSTVGHRAGRQQMPISSSCDRSSGPMQRDRVRSGQCSGRTLWMKSLNEDWGCR
jgi:hypothetical protein